MAGEMSSMRRRRIVLVKSNDYLSQSVWIVILAIRPRSSELQSTVHLVNSFNIGAFHQIVGHCLN
jgi:hypothetical protein